MTASESNIIARVFLEGEGNSEFGDSVTFNDVSFFTVTQTRNSLTTFSITVPARIERTGKPNIEIDKLLEGGEAIYIALVTHSGEKRQVTSSAIGIIRTIATTQTLTTGSQSDTVTLNCGSFVSLMANDTINYYTLYGSLQGVARALAFVPIDYLDVVHLDVALDAFIRYVGFNILNVKRSIGDIDTLFAYKIRSIEGKGLFSGHIQNYTGNLWELFTTYGELPLHEILDTVLPLEEWNQLGGFQNTPQTFGSDDGVNSLVFRPVPFPYSTDGTTVNFDLWETLPIHDLTQGDFQNMNFNVSRGEHGIANFVAIHPKTLETNEVNQYFFTPPILNETKWEKWGYKPLSWETFLWGTGEDVTEAGVDYFNELNWRVAVQNNRLDEMLFGTIGLPRLAPHIKVGQRVKANYPLGSNKTYQFYVESVTHTFDPQGTRTTTLVVSRGLPNSIYNPSGSAWFLEGLRALPPIGDQVNSVSIIRLEEEEGPVDYQLVITVEVE